MATLVLHPTDMSQWQAMIYEAQSESGIILSENTESYLVFLLMRQVQNHRLLDSILATDLLESMHCKASISIGKLQEVGDKSLLFCGLFPGIIKKRRVNYQYYLDLGKSAYMSAGDLGKSQEKPLFYELSQEFEQLQHVLLTMTKAA